MLKAEAMMELWHAMEYWNTTRNDPIHVYPEKNGKPHREDFEDFCYTILKGVETNSCRSDRTS